ncbi:MAG TPA: hypothetical protein VMW09_03420 [Desulfatiglandales bacterium]|nr:hypothetical protein [Desulfatiglandales bacterium]
MDDGRAFELYKLANQHQISWLNLHRQHLQQYFVLIAALFGASLGAIYHFRHDPWFTIAVIVGPLLGALLSITAVGMCDRFYRSFLESVTIHAKLAPIVGVTEKRSMLPNKKGTIPFPDDIHYIPERWFESRSCFKTSEDFVQKHMRLGANRFAFWSFRILLVANILFIIGIIINVVRTI